MTRVTRTPASCPGLRVERLEHRTQRGSREVAVDDRLLVAGDPSLDHADWPLRLQAMDQLRTQPVGAGEQAHVDHPGDDDLGDIGRDVIRGRQSCGRLLERCLLDTEERAVEIEQLAGEALTRAQL